MGEALTIPILVLDKHLPKTASLHWRPMGEGSFRKIAVEHVARGVHRATLPPATGTTIRVLHRSPTAAGENLRWPVTAPELNQTVVTA